MADKRKVSKEDLDKCKVLTPTFRVSFPHLDKPQTFDQGAPKYGVTMLFPKNTDMKPLLRAIRQAKINEWGPDKEDWPEMESIIKDGDSKKYKDYEGFAGHYVVKASSSEERKPGLVAKSGSELLENASDLYPGSRARAKLFCRAFIVRTEKGKILKQGVHFVLDNIQFVGDDKPFGGRESALEAFDAVDGEEDSDIESGDDEEQDF